jgi:imidazolonepropionase-like amidohydrolase
LLKAIQQVTGNNARILGQEERPGGVRVGDKADPLVVKGY